MTAPKKILVLAGATYVYGAEKVTLSVCGFLQKAGHHIHCIVNGWNNGEFIGYLNQLHIPYSTIKLGWYYFTKIKWSLDSLLHYPGALLRFIKISKKEKPDIVYVTSYRPVILLYPLLKKNTVYHVHDPISETKQGRFFIKIADNKISRYIAVSAFIKNDLIKCGVNSDKITIVYNGVGETHIGIEPGCKKNEGNILRVGIVGQVIARKGHDVLISALSLIKDKLPFECSIFGSGDAAYIHQLKQQIENNHLQQQVRWMGVEKEKKNIYENMDVLVAPTKNDEPFALVALEASAFGVPAIVTKSGGFPESIVDGKTGFIVNKNAPEEIADKLFLCYQSPSLMGQMGKQARENISNHFSLEKMEKNITAVINNFN